MSVLPYSATALTAHTPLTNPQPHIYSVTEHNLLLKFPKTEPNMLIAASPLYLSRQATTTWTHSAQESKLRRTNTVLIEFRYLYKVVSLILKHILNDISTEIALFESYPMVSGHQHSTRIIKPELSLVNELFGL